MRKKLKIEVFYLMCIAVLFSPFGYAESNSGYAEWKALQQSQDQQLKKAGVIKHQQHSTQKQSATQSANHYLARPALSANSQANQIRINSASIAELQSLNGIGQKKAEAIVEYRTKNGKFKTIEDIQLVKGIGPALFAKNKARMAL